jgi:hypothetical protein
VSAYPSAGPPPDLSAHWIRANVTAAAIAVVLGLVAFGIRQMLGMPDPNAGFVARAVLLVAEVVLAALALAIYANRTGAVLERKLPNFPTLTWVALHILVGVALGIFVAFSGMGAAPTPYEAPEKSLVVSIAIGGIVAGALIGALLGALQGLVLRKVVREVGGWVQWSALAGTAFGGYALVLYVGSEPALENEILTQLVSFAVSVAGGAIMLPALHQLQPK